MSSRSDAAPLGSGATAADQLLDGLQRHGIEWLFANPGTDFPPIIEALARAKTSGRKLPQPLLVPHENCAVAMAHGAYLVTGKPQALMVHVNVGTANAINLLANASRDRVPLLLLAGRSPIMEAGAFGARSRPIHWAQEMFDQGGMVREFVKWEYELRNPAQVTEVVERAVEAAMAPPRGPVYLTLPREPLAAPAVANAPAAIRALPSPAHPDPEAMARLAGWLARAERPLLIASSLGRVPEEAEALGRLADRFGLPVVAHAPRYACLASDHPQHHGYDPGPYIAEADLILVIESDVPWLPASNAPMAGARIVHIGEDPAFLRYPMRGFAGDLSITADVGAALRALETAMQGQASAFAERICARRHWGEQRARARRSQIAAPTAATAHITPEYLSQCIGGVAGADALIFNEYQLRLDHCPRPRPGSYFGLSPAGGLGWSVGAALGAKLAAPERFVIAVIGDGGFLFANPVACHWAAEAHALPVLMVIFNNARYGAVRNATLAMFPAGAAARDNGLLLADLSPSPPFAALATEQGAFALHVERPLDLPGALCAAREAVLGARRHALVNVITPY
jgi:acetolactate synthase I/II/III large subunit